MDMNAVMLWATPIVEVRNPDHHKIKDALVRAGAREVVQRDCQEFACVT